MSETITLMQVTPDQITSIAYEAAMKAAVDVMEMKAKENLLITKEVAKRLRVSIKTVTNQMAENKIAGAFPYGIQWRISEYDLDQHILKLKSRHNE